MYKPSGVLLSGSVSSSSVCVCVLNTELNVLFSVSPPSPLLGVAHVVDVHTHFDAVLTRTDLKTNESHYGKADTPEKRFHLYACLRLSMSVCVGVCVCLCLCACV